MRRRSSTGACALPARSRRAPRGRRRSPPNQEPERSPVSDVADNRDAVEGEMNDPSAAQCPVAHGLTDPLQGDANQQWWPHRLNLKVLAKNPAVANPLGEDFDYAQAFQSLDLAAVK